ncbi:MAG: DUF4416 family protein [Deltaproteobacteria bacterium]|nr:DUF4416 family protein [Deltaproteobacteria bacterium]
MRRANLPEPVKLFSSVIATDVSSFTDVRVRLKAVFGAEDYVSDVARFAHTDYYKEEMGPALSRIFVSYAKLVAPEEIAAAKLFTNEVEEAFLGPNGKRRVNIDPGYVTLHNVVLASTKNFSHRVHIRGGVYAEPTLLYSKKEGGFRPLEWTYPDYSAKEAREMFSMLRRMYQKEIRA